jgi:DNA-binding transcriptional MerR regulator
MIKNRIASASTAASLTSFATGLSQRQARSSRDKQAETERMFSIGDLAREFGVSLRTLRFYEDRGLLSPKRQGTMRLYGARERVRLSMILKGKQLGFTLGEISAMLASDEAARGTPGELKLSLDQIKDQISHLERQKAEIETAIEELVLTRERLAAQIAAA